MRIFIIYIILLLNTACVFSQVDRTKAPESDTPTPINVGKMETIKLDNGLKIYLVQKTGYPKFTININIEQPAINEDEFPEIREIVNSAFYKNPSTKKYTNKEIESTFKFYGADKGITLNGGFIRGLKRDIDKLLPICSDLLTNIIITEDNIKEFSGKKKKENKKKKNSGKDSKFNKNDYIDSLLYGKTSQKKEIKEKQLNYDNINIGDCYNYLKRRIVTSNTSILIFGDFTKEESKDLINRYFENWEKGKKLPSSHQTKLNKQILAKRKILVIDAPNSSQERISFNWGLNDAPTYFNKHIELEVLNEIFGGSQMSYVYRNLREDKGLCYFVGSSVSPNASGGTGAVWGSFKQGKSEIVIENILLEMLRIKNMDVSDKDLKIAKGSLIGKESRAMSGIATTPYISFSMVKDDYNLPDNYLQTRIPRIYNVSKKDIRTMAEKYIKPFECVISVNGNVREIKGKLEKFGEVIYLDKDGKIFKF